MQRIEYFPHHPAAYFLIVLQSEKYIVAEITSCPRGKALFHVLYCIFILHSDEERVSMPCICSYMSSSESLPSLLEQLSYSTSELTGQLGRQKVFLFLYLIFSVQDTSTELAASPLGAKPHM